MSERKNSLEIAQYLRYHMVPITKVAGAADGVVGKQRRSPVKDAKHPLVARVAEIGRPYEGFALIFDTETTPFDGQKLRFGTYQIRGIAPQTRLALAQSGRLTRAYLDSLQESGIFYAPENLAGDEIELLQRYAAQHGMTIMTRGEFIRDVLVGTGRYWKEYWKHDGLVIGFNLPFDIGAVATDFWLAKGDYHGGFGFKMCDCGGATRKHCAFHPGIRTYPIAPRKHMFEWCPTRLPRQYWKDGKETGFAKTNRRKSNFLDVSQFARALLGYEGGGSLEQLCSSLNVETQKQSRDDHGGPLTIEYIDYAVSDVQSTWELYTKLRDIYRQHGIARPMWKIYSEASIGKGYLHELGVPRFMQQHACIPLDVVGKFMSAYYGGRSEVRERLSSREIIHCDFKSQYPTVNALMRLQDLLLAERIELRVNGNDAREFLETVTIVDLQDRNTWPKLRGVAKIRPRNDVLPVRAEFGNAGGATNIALCNVESRLDVYYTFADVLASKLLTGKCPEILETIELIPHGQVPTKSWALFWDPRYFIDLSTDDLFTRLIDLRSEIKGLAANGPEDQRAYHRMMEMGLKLLANSTSYGALVEVVDEDRAELRSCEVFRGDRDRGERHRTQKLESPGPYFAGPVGVLIPAAGRLLLAIAERLGLDRGIGHVFCDTDGMSYARPDDLDHTTFAAKLREIIDWFTPLSPYQTEGSIFQLEIPKPKDLGSFRWRCIAVSAKRYAIYRRGSQGEPAIVFMKISSHGMGAIRDPAGYRSIFPDAPLRNEIEKLVTSKATALLIYDIWREAIEAMEAEKPIPRERVHLRGHPYFNPVRIGNAHQLKLYQTLDNLRPFMFFSTVPPLVGLHDPFAISEERFRELTDKSLYGPHAKSFAEIRDRLFFRDTDQPIALTDDELRYLRFQTLEDRLQRYFDHKEHKAYPPDGIGMLQRRNVKITHLRHLGKEMIAIPEHLEDADEELEWEFRRGRLVIGPENGFSGSGRKIDPELVKRLRAAPLRELERMTGISRPALGRYRQGQTAPEPGRLAMILAALEAIEQDALADKSRTKQAAQLRGRIKSLSAGDHDISGFARVMRLVEADIPRARFKAFMLRDQTLSPTEMELITTTVVRLEREDFPSGPVSFTGQVLRVRWNNNRTNETIFEMQITGCDLPTVVKGRLPYAGPGLTVSVEGVWRYHEEYGQQVEAEKIAATLPGAVRDIKRYLVELPGIGRMLAFSLTRQFGGEVFHIVRDEPGRLSGIKGMTEAVVNTLRRVVGQSQRSQDVGHDGRGTSYPLGACDE